MTATLTVYVVTKDLERTRRFYEEGLGVPSGEQSGLWLPFALAGATFALHGARDDDPEDMMRANVSFGVDDIEAAVARFERAGGRVLRGVADEAYGKRALIQDPDGRTFELVRY